MSAKQDKRLRKAARGLAVTLDQAGKPISERGLGTMGANKSTLVNQPNSLRGIVRNLKKGVRQGKIIQPA
jgi:hypothetical protein